jgi:hypothetical protein
MLGDANAQGATRELKQKTLFQFGRPTTIYSKQKRHLAAHNTRQLEGEDHLQSSGFIEKQNMNLCLQSTTEERRGHSRQVGCVPLWQTSERKSGRNAGLIICFLVPEQNTQAWIIMMARV